LREPFPISRIPTFIIFYLRHVWTTSGSGEAAPTCAPVPPPEASSAAESWPQGRGTFRLSMESAQNQASLRSPVIERVLQQAGWRHASRGEAETLHWGGGFWASFALFNRTLHDLPKHSRIAVCPGLNGLWEKQMLRTNIVVFEAAMAFSSAPRLPFLMPAPWRMPAEIDSVSRASSGWVMLRPINAARGEDTYVFRANESHDILGIVSRTAPKKTWDAVEYVLPHLVFGRKWDFRVFLLVVGFDPMRVYLGGLELGFVRLALKSFSLDDRDPFVHSSNSYDGKSVLTKTLPFDRTNRTFRDTLSDFVRDHMELATWSGIWQQVERIVLRSVLAIEPKIRTLGRHSLAHSAQCFEVMGVDFMLDDHGALKLLEIQRAPDWTDTFVPGASVKGQVLADSLCLATGTGCFQASQAKHSNLSQTMVDDMRPGLVPFEHASDDVAALRREVFKESQRAAWTRFERLWPPPPRHASMLRELDATETWALSLYTRAILGALDLAYVPDVAASVPRRMGTEAGLTISNF